LESLSRLSILDYEKIEERKHPILRSITSYARGEASQVIVISSASVAIHHRATVADFQRGVLYRVLVLFARGALLAEP
jgi:hypothetical protein